MKQKIKSKDIRPGDIIREERDSADNPTFLALEYVAQAHWKYASNYTYYLLERPEPPFKPKDGTIIVKNDDCYYVAVRIMGEWMGKDPHKVGHWHGKDEWAKQRLAEGWKILETSE